MKEAPNPLIQRLVAHRRLAILRCLAGVPAEERERLLVLRLLSMMPGGFGNVALLRDLTADAGAPLVRDRVMALGAWLADHGLLVMAREEGVVGLHLTERGGDVAEGRQAWPGVSPVTDANWLRRRLVALSIAASQADIEADVAFLAEAQLVTTHVTGDLLVLTAAGVDVTTGQRIVEGVQRPSRGAVLTAAAASALATLKGGQ